jgi:aspartyl-tRNA synthetase
MRGLTGGRLMLVRAWSSSGRRLAGETTGLEGSEVRLSGWLASMRPMKKLAFAVLRDHSGSVQLQASGAVAEELGDLPVESAVTVVGTVVARPAKAVNTDMATGKVEVVVKAIEWSNRCAANLPFPVGDASVSEEVRLTHRFLDLRSEQSQAMLRARARIVQALRTALTNESFVEVETPTLFRPTPEGAKEFLVATRWPDSFYALPQSPQQ